MQTMPFSRNTRRKIIQLSSMAKGTTNPLVWTLPKTGFLAGIYLKITGSVSGTLSAPNAWGMASIVRRIKLTANSGPQLIDLSGIGYHYLLRDFIEDYKDPVPSATARSAVTATTFDVSVFLPVSINSRDPVGLVALQNEETQVQLSVEFEADASVATGATVAATVVPYIELFTVPVNPKDWPDLTTVHQIVEDQRAISATGEYRYSWPRGNSYLQVLHGYGIAVSGSDKVNSAKLTVNNSEDIFGPLPPAAWGLEFSRFHGRARLSGVTPIDLTGSSGLGMFGSIRDLLYSQLITDLDTVFDIATASDTLYTVRRQLVALNG